MPEMLHRGRGTRHLIAAVAPALLLQASCALFGARGTAPVPRCLAVTILEWPPGAAPAGGDSAYQVGKPIVFELSGERLASKGPESSVLLFRDRSEGGTAIPAGYWRSSPDGTLNLFAQDAGEAGFWFAILHGDSGTVGTTLSPVTPERGVVRWRPEPCRSSPTTLAADASQPVLLLAPRAVGTIVLMALEYPPAGQRIGGNFEGLRFEREVSTLQLSDGARVRLARRGLDAGAAVLRGAGFTVRDAPERSSDAEPLPDVRFGLSAQVALSVHSSGAVAPRRITTEATVTWELLDLSAGAVIYVGETPGRSQLNDSLETGISQAVERAYAALIDNLAFRTALSRRRPANIEDIAFGAAWAHPLPAADDTIWIEPGDLLPLEDRDPVQRVAAGVLSAYGRRARPVTAVSLTRTGLAIAQAGPWQGGPFWGRFADGVERPLRVLRVRAGLSLIELRCDDPCPTVSWGDTIPLRNGSPVFAVGAPEQRGQAFWVNHGRVSRTERWTLYNLSVSYIADGEPVARRDDGEVVAVVVNGRGVAIQEALRLLGVAVRR